jgi:hypothetical protein
MLWIPAGLAHGFRVLSDEAHVLYKATDFYHPESERTLIWDDPEVNINWQLDTAPIMSEKDAKVPLSATQIPLHRKRRPNLRALRQSPSARSLTSAAMQGCVACATERNQILFGIIT